MQHMKWTFSQKSKTKKHSKTQVDEKSCLFMMLFIILFVSISPMHVRWLLLYIIKDDSNEGLWNSLFNVMKDCGTAYLIRDWSWTNGKMKLVTHLCLFTTLLGSLSQEVL